MEAYGEIDDLNSAFGLVQSKVDIGDDIKADIALIQQLLFDCSTDLSVPKGHREYKMTKEPVVWAGEPNLTTTATNRKKTQYFIIPGGTELAGWFHILRTTTRNAERRIVDFLEEEPEEVNPFVLQFINRLSDYLFILARVANARKGVPDVPYERSEKVFRVANPEPRGRKGNDE